MAQQQTGVETKTDTPPTNTISAAEFNSINDTVNNNSTDAESRLTTIEGASASILSYSSGTLPSSGIGTGTLAFFTDENVMIYVKDDVWYRVSDDTAVAGVQGFIMTVDTTVVSVSNSDQFNLLIPMVQTGFTPITVDWGDGNSTTASVYNDANLLHTYSVGGTYDIEISGIFQLEYQNGTAGNTDSEKIQDIKNWGDLTPAAASDFGFAWCSNMVITASDSPDTSTAADLSGFFYGCDSITTIPSLDLTSCVSMSSFLFDCDSITTIPSMDTSGITNFDSFAEDCTSLTTVPLLDYSSGTNFNQIYQTCALNTTSIDNIMAGFVASGVASKTTHLNGGTSLAEASWSAQAQTDVATLRGNGWTVNTN